MARHHPRILGCVVKGLSGASTAAEQPTATATRSALFLGNWRRFLARTRGMLKSDGWVLLEWDDDDAHEPLTDLLARSPPVAQSLAARRRSRSWPGLLIPAFYRYRSLELTG